MNYHLFGNKYLEVPNEPEAFVINYYLKAEGSSPAKITVTDASGQVVRQVTGTVNAGLNQAFVPLAGGGGDAGSAAAANAAAAPRRVRDRLPSGPTR